MKAKLTFEIDGKVERIWKLDCGTDAMNTFDLLKMGYFNGTYLECISKEFDPMIEIKEEKSQVANTIKMLQLLRGVDDRIIDNKIIELKEYLKELK